MEQLVGKVAKIAVDYLSKEENLFLRENVEILEQKEIIVNELIG